MNTMNQCIFQGRIIKDPEVTSIPTTNGPMQKIRFTIAVDRALSSQKKQQAVNNGQPTCDFVPLSAVGSNADFILKYCPVGKAINVVAHYATWQSIDQTTGQKRYGHNFEVDALGFAVQDSKSLQQSGNQSPTPPPASQPSFSNPYADPYATPPASTNSGTSQTPPNMNFAENSQTQQNNPTSQPTPGSNYEMFDKDTMPF